MIRNRKVHFVYKNRQFLAFFYIIIEGSGTLSEMLLCGNTCPPFTNTSSLTITSSPSTVIPSNLTHRPTIHRHPMIQELSHECDLTIAPFRRVHRLIQTPVDKRNFFSQIDSHKILETGCLDSCFSSFLVPCIFGEICHVENVYG